MNVIIDKESRAKRKVICPIKEGPLALTFVNNPAFVIEHFIEHSSRLINFLFSTAYHSITHAISNAKKNENTERLLLRPPIMIRQCLIRYNLKLKLNI